MLYLQLVAAERQFSSGAPEGNPHQIEYDEIPNENEDDN